MAFFQNAKNSPMTYSVLYDTYTYLLDYHSQLDITEHLCASDADRATDFLGANLDKMEADGSNLPAHPTLLLGAIPNSAVLWQAEPPPDENAQSYYSFSQFAMSLNQVF